MEAKNWYSSQVLFTILHFFRPFVSVPHPRLTVLAGDAYSAVTQQGKVYIDRARGIRSLADQILAIGWDDIEERGVPDKSNDISVEPFHSGEEQNNEEEAHAVVAKADDGGVDDVNDDS